MTDQQKTADAVTEQNLGAGAGGSSPTPKPSTPAPPSQPAKPPTQAPGAPPLKPPVGTGDQRPTQPIPSAHTQPGSEKQEQPAQTNPSLPTQALSASERAMAPSTITEFSGAAGGPFALYGTFPAGATVKINGRQVDTLSRTSRSIKGMVPADMKSGEATIEVGDARFKGRI